MGPILRGQMDPVRKAPPAPDLGALPALVVGPAGAAWRNPDGTAESFSHDEAARRLRGGAAPLICHAPAAARRLGLRSISAYDVLELFAFVRPAQFCVPTPRGIAAALDGSVSGGHASEPDLLVAVAEALLAAVARIDQRNDPGMIAIAETMALGGWRWGELVLRAIGPELGAKKSAGIEIWRGLPEWAERAPEPPPGNKPVEPVEARARLAQLLGARAEARPQQADYASAVSAAFLPREQAGVPHAVLADAGTGVGKTLGYIAPASVWAEKNGGAVWISTFTRNLQHQIDQELDQLYPDPAEKARKAVVRKGRENYLCLLNYEEAAGAARVRAQDAVSVGLVARWAAATRDGALIGGDFSGWLADLVGRGRAAALADRRGECIYSACQHYTRCFIEHGVRRARRAEIVVANHALVMIQAALGGDDRFLPTRYVFDEGHHVFNAADAAFSGHLTGQETADLRRWIRGAEARGRGRSRARGLQARLGDLAAGDEAAVEAIDAAVSAAAELPGEGWIARLAADQPAGTAERYFALVRRQVYARARGPESAYGIETETQPAVDGLIEAAAVLDAALADLMVPLGKLAERLAARLDDEADALDTGTRNRIDAMARGLKRRTEMQIAGWRAMLQALTKNDADHEAGEAAVDWFSVERVAGRDADIGQHRHFVDPTRPFAEIVAAQAHGLIVTSATLRDGSGDAEADWVAAETMTGARHLPAPAIRAAVPSPFDYPKLTRVIVVNDVGRETMDRIAAAYRELMIAAGGGALGLFTAISRLRAVHKALAGPLEAAGLPLYAQHVDGLDVSTLIDIFRAETDACLLGTDAVRDGVDVPGRSLRLIVFDRVPWPRPTILHKARRAAFGGNAYDDMLVRLRLKQAYGRLTRRADDHGVFVMLDNRLPSRLASAFPEGVAIERIGLADAVEAVRSFLPGGETPRAT
ncbi:MAG: ATP-dependent DNA helicase [Alphaproteobacteria bacterium]|nr:ATP-dependent DNA helicase [Alphaproteobacteria bacterium]